MTFSAFLAETAAERCWILKILPLSLAALEDEAADGFGQAGFGEAAFSEGSTVDSATLFYSSHGYTSKSTDTPASTFFDARIAGEPRVERVIFGRDGIGGLARTLADVRLVNADGELDELQDEYALDGRPAQLLLGRPGDALADFGLVFAGVIEAVEKGDVNSLSLKLSDGIARLDSPVNRNTFAGSGDLEGGADLAGKPKPRGWGVAKNIAPPLVDGTRLIYQVNDGWIWDVMAVRDRGVGLTHSGGYTSAADLLANAPSAGTYRVWHEGGYFRLGATPSGTVTCDLAGDSTGPSGAGYVGGTSPILERVLLLAGIDASLLQASAFSQLATDASAEVGIWRGAESATVGELVEELLAGVGAFGGFSRTGLFTVGVVKAPEGSPLATYTEAEIGLILREPLPPAVEPVVWLARVAWGKNYTVQADIAAGALAADRTFAAEAQRISKLDDSTVKGQRILAKEYGPNGNLYSSQASGDAEALRLLNLWKVPRGLYRVSLPAIALERDLGDLVAIQHARYGFSAGKNARVLGHVVRGTLVELVVLA